MKQRESSLPVGVSWGSSASFPIPQAVCWLTQSVAGLPLRVCPDLHIHTFPPLTTHLCCLSNPNSLNGKSASFPFVSQVLIPVLTRAIPFILSFQSADPGHSLPAETENALVGVSRLETQMWRIRCCGDVRLSNHLPTVPLGRMAPRPTGTWRINNFTNCSFFGN